LVEGISGASTVHMLLANTSLCPLPFFSTTCTESLFLSPTGPGKDLEFTVVRPGGLTLEPANGLVNVVEGKAGSISRADVAGFLRRAVTEESFPYLRMAPCLSSEKGTGWTKDRTAKTQGHKAAE